MAKGKDYGYGQQEGSYIKPQKIDGKYYVRDQSFSLREVPKPKPLPNVKGKDPRPMPNKPNPRAQTTAQMDQSLRKAERDWAAGKTPKSNTNSMNPYYKTAPGAYKGTPSVLDGLRSFIRGGGLRISGR
jgi:hypothetical protein